MQEFIPRAIFLLILIPVLVFSQREHEKSNVIQKENIVNNHIPENGAYENVKTQLSEDSLPPPAGYNEPPNSLFFEAFGQGIFFTFNYERYIDNHFALRLGYGGWFSRVYSIPFMVNYYSGNRHKLELGVGFVYHQGWAIESMFNKNKPIALTSTIGYKFQPSCDSLMLRVGFTPFYSLRNNMSYLMFGLSVGICFY